MFGYELVVKGRTTEETLNQKVELLNLEQYNTLTNLGMIEASYVIEIICIVFNGALAYAPQGNTQFVKYALVPCAKVNSPVKIYEIATWDIKTTFEVTNRKVFLTSYDIYNRYFVYINKVPFFLIR